MRTHRSEQRVSWLTALQRPQADNAGMKPTATSRRPRLAMFAVVTVLASTVVAGAPPASAGVLPHVTARVNCKIAATATDPFDVYWFGYSSDANYWVSAGLANKIVEKNAGGSEIDVTANRGQVIQFKSGEHRRTFAVRVAAGNRPEWSVTVALTIQETLLPASTSVAVPNGSTPLCSAKTPRHSAVAQVAGAPTITFEAVGRRLDDNGKLVASAVRFKVGGVSSVCSAGGQPMPPQILWGYDAGPGITPVRRSSVVRTDILKSAFQSTLFDVPFVRTWTDRLGIRDPQEASTNNLGETFYGVSQAGVIADVFARCKVNGKVITSAHPLWVAIDGSEVKFFWYTDGTQRTVATPCVPSGLDVLGCPFKGGNSGGGGAFAKR